MSDCTDDFRAMKAEARDRKRNNLETSTQILVEKGIVFDSHANGVHLVVTLNAGARADFWPSTGKFINRKTHVSGRGIFNLLKLVAKEK